ncbi:MAG TPA: response regulator [Terriglobales bacterium]|nr:response regulator [Terriglobales bacterium]
MSTVLLIDDSKFVRRATEMAIARFGYTVFSAADGEEGLRVAQSKTPSVIVLDMMLPKISGLQLLQALKQDPRTAGIPVIVMSSLPQSNEAKLKESGAAGYLEKSQLGVEAGAANLLQMIRSILSALKNPS